MTDKTRITVSLDPRYEESIAKYKEDHGFTQDSKTLETLIYKGLEVCAAEGALPKVREPPKLPVPSDITADFESLLQTITPEQASLLCVIAKKALTYAKANANRK